GYVDDSTTSTAICSVKSVPAFTHFTITTRTHELLQRYENALQSINFDLFPEFNVGTAGLSRDDFIEMKESLYSLCEAYDDDQHTP
ncbi:8098_t:CDS:1, partial [Acaulospora morrowiae]